MLNSQISKWLLFVGKNFSITEAHHMWRPDSKLRTPADYFTFETISSTPIDRHRLDDTIASVQDLTHTISKFWRTIISVSCHSDNGRYILQCLEATRNMPDVVEIFGETAKNMGCGVITSDPWIDESSKENIFKIDFEFIECVSFSMIETDGLVLEVEMNGTAEAPDGYGNIDLYVLEP